MAGTLGIVTLVTWLLTASIGGYMLASLVRGSGRRRNGGARPPVILAGHFGLALSGLLAWTIFVATGWAAAAWAALGLLMPAIGLGVSTVTIWTPFPGRRAGPAAGPGPGPASATSAGATSDSATNALPGGAQPGPRGPAVPEPPGPISDAEFASALTDAARTSQLIDELLADLLAGPQRASRRPRWPVQALIPAGHGIAAGVTFVLAVLTVAGTR
jgi:hypothetical protein